MKLSSLFASLTLASAASAALPGRRSPKHVGKKSLDYQSKSAFDMHSFAARSAPLNSRQSSSRYLTNSTQKFVVNGSAIPDVDFDIGESYAGLLPIGTSNSSELYFWFFPSSNPAAEKEILIWLNGGPGCSSLEGLLQENGPFLWQYGTYKPVANPWTWVNLTNVVWVEQPVGTGYSQGTPTATNENDVTEQFMGFFKNFVDTFGMQGYTVYIAGESYAGYYVPYIADGFLNSNDTTYYNLSSILVYDGVYSYNSVGEQIPTVPFVDYWGPVLDLNASTLDTLHQLHNECGYAQFMEEALVYPPKGALPTPPNADADNTTCDTWDYAINAITAVNPCFDVYQVLTTCPILWDVLGFPGSIPYLPEGATIYFNRSDVQRAINAPIQEWEECSSIDVFVNGTDNSPPSGLSVLPGVIERTDRTILGHGIADMILLFNGTMIAVQNMTWNGGQGFSVAPSQWASAYVPYHEEASLSTLAGAGNMGQYHTERGLTVVTTVLSGHMVPQYAPSASYRHVEYLLGRIDNLGVVGPFTTMQGTSY